MVWSIVYLRRYSVQAALALLVTCSLGCPTPTDYDWGSPPVNDLGTGDCDPSDRKPSLCGWVLASDAIIVGEVQSVEAIFAPMLIRFDGEEDRIVDSESEALGLCPESDVGPGLKLDVRVVEVVHSTTSLPMSVDQIVEVHLGRRPFRRWDSTPSAWEEDAQVTGWNGEGEIVVDDVLGLPLSIDSDGERAVLGYDSIFVEVDGQVRFLETGASCAPYEGSPVDDAAGSFQQLKGRAPNCTPNDLAENELEYRSERRDALNIPFSHGAECIETIFD